MNYIIQNERRIAKCDRRVANAAKELEVFNKEFAKVQTKFKLSLIGLAGSLIFAILYLS